MKPAMKDARVWLLGVVALGGCALAGWFWLGQQRAERRELEAEAKAQAAMEALALLRAKPAVAGDSASRASGANAAAAPAAPSAAAGAKPDTPPPPKARRLVSEGQPEYYRRIVEDPEAAALFATQQRLQLRAKYEHLLTRLHLSPGEEAALLNRLAEKRITAMDTANVANSHGLAPNDPAVLQGFDRANAESDQAIRALLGDARYAQYKDFDAKLPQYANLYGIERDIALSGAPLTPEQAESMIAIMQGAGGARRPDDPSWEAQSAYAREYANRTDAALAQAATVLGPEQLAALKNYFARIVISVQLQAALQRGEDAGGGK